MYYFNTPMLFKMNNILGSRSRSRREQYLIWEPISYMSLKNKAVLRK